MAKFREAFKFSGSKSDPLDTAQILEILTKHLDQLQPLRPESPEIRLLARLVEDRRKAVSLRASHIQALQASLKEYFPQAIEILNRNLTSILAGNFLKKWPDWEAFAQAKPAVLRKFFYAHNLRSAELVEKILRLAATSQALTTDKPIVESGRRLSQMYSQLIQSLNKIIASYEERIEEVFSAHPDSALFSHLPGAGPAMAPRLLAFFGADRSRYKAASNVHCFTGVAPVTRSSGRSEVVYSRRACPEFARQTFHEFARLSIQSCQWARNYVDYYTERGKSFHTVIRALAFKWIRILFRCWQTRTPYHEETYLAALKKSGSIFATLHLEKKS